MHPYDFAIAKRRLDPQKELVKALRVHFPDFRKHFRDYMYLLITVKGHAWCMDVKEERHRMSRLITAAVEEMFELGGERRGIRGRSDADHID